MKKFKIRYFVSLMPIIGLVYVAFLSNSMYKRRHDDQTYEGWENYTFGNSNRSTGAFVIQMISGFVFAVYAVFSIGQFLSRS